MDDPIRGSSEEPRYLVERAADAGIKAIAEVLAHADTKIERLLILLDAETTPGDEPDSTSAGVNVEDARDVVALCVLHATSSARQIGLKIDLLPIHGRPQG